MAAISPDEDGAFKRVRELESALPDGRDATA
jgi:hypothetical protein